MARPAFIRVDSNVEAIARELGVSDPKVIRRATVSGLNRGMTVAGKSAINSAAKAVGIKPSSSGTRRSVSGRRSAV